MRKRAIGRSLGVLIALVLVGVAGAARAADQPFAACLEEFWHG
jgi:hypothetical protein